MVDTLILADADPGEVEATLDYLATTADDYEYDGGDFDDAYENPDDHAEFCDWIYDNCTCGIEKCTPITLYTLPLYTLLWASLT